MKNSTEQYRVGFEAWMKTRPGYPFAAAFANLMWESWLASKREASTEPSEILNASIVDDVIDLFAACGFEVRPDGGPFALAGSLDAGGIIVEALTEKFASPQPAGSAREGGNTSDHLAPENIVATIRDLREIEDPETPLRDRDWRTWAGVLARLIENLAGSAGALPDEAANTARYTCIGKGGVYELVGPALPAGELKERTPYHMTVYRDSADGMLYVRLNGDFDVRMKRIDAAIEAQTKIGSDHA